jgi:hypothetical protein
LDALRIWLCVARTALRKVSIFATDICVAVYVGAMCWCLLAPLTWHL